LERHGLAGHVATQHHNDAIERRRFDVGNHMRKQRAGTKRQGLLRPTQASRRPRREDDSDHIGHPTMLGRNVFSPTVEQLRSCAPR
jgi:hypothetical protein